jgi:hypothetical protein
MSGEGERLDLLHPWGTVEWLAPPRLAVKTLRENPRLPAEVGQGDAEVLKAGLGLPSGETQMGGQMDLIQTPVLPLKR